MILRRHTRWIAALAIVLVALVLLWILWGLERAPTQPFTPSTGGGPVKPRGPENSAAVPAAHTPVRPATPDDAPREQPRESPPPVTAQPVERKQDAPVEAPKRVVSLRFVNDQGSPARRVAFCYEVLDGERVAGVMMDKASLKAGSPALKAASDDDGLFVLPEEALAPRAAAVWLAPVSTQQRAVVARPIPAELDQGQTLFALPQGSGTETITLVTTDSIQFYLEFADGAPFTGGLGLREMKGEISLSSKGHDLVNVHYFVASGVSRVNDLEVGLFSARLGYRTEVRFRFTPEQLKRIQTCTVPRYEFPQSGITINIVGPAASEPFRARILEHNGGVLFSKYLKQGESVTTLDVHPRVGYRVIVYGKGLTWESEDIFLKENEVRVLDAELLPPVEYTVRVLDENGNPAWPAALTRNPHWYPPWDDGRISKPAVGPPNFEAPEYAIVTAKGVAVMTGVPSGPRVLKVEARGYEPKLIEVNGRPGEKVDLGTVTMVQASGRITVKLLNRREGAQYRVYLMGPRGGSMVERKLDVTNESVVFERLPRREYVVFACAGSGLTGTSVVTKFTESGEDLVVEIDCARLEYANLPRK